MLWCLVEGSSYADWMIDRHYGDVWLRSQKCLKRLPPFYGYAGGVCSAPMFEVITESVR